jgi:hypothetical protein
MVTGPGHDHGSRTRGGEPRVGREADDGGGADGGGGPADVTHSSGGGEPVVPGSPGEGGHAGEPGEADQPAEPGDQAGEPAEQREPGEPREPGERREPRDPGKPAPSGGASGAGSGRPSPPPDVPLRDAPGGRIVAVDVWATGLFVLVSLAAAAWPDPLEIVSVPLDLVLFAVGCGAFLWAYAVAIGRSRYETVTMAGVFFLAGGSAPANVARALRLALAVQAVVGVAVAAARPFTALAFAVLVPMLGLGLMALWGARHGVFPARDDVVPDDGADPPPDRRDPHDRRDRRDRGDRGDRGARPADGPGPAH